MPRITISVIAPSTPRDNEILTLDLPPSLTLGDLKGFVEAETNIPQNSQVFYLNNSPLNGDSKTLEEVGINDGDMLAMVTRQPNQNEGGSRQQQTSSSGQSAAPQLGAHQIETTRLQILGDPRAMAQVRQQRPALAEAIHDKDRFREVWMEMVREQEARDREMLRSQELLNEDPYNEEAQRKIEEIIRQESVQENLQFAYEHNPEVFARVTMLYIEVEVNKHPVKAFVDSGAQTTIMSPTCAEACGIKRLIDKRYAGIAKGVGTAQILGRVHSAPIRIGSFTMSCSFTVMEGKDVDMLLGLDMLKRFQAVIDLKHNKLIFGDGNEVSFLGEADIPKMLEDAMENEPTVSGPNGTEIGAQTGTVKPAGTSAAAAAAAASSSKDSAFRGPGQTLGNTPSSSNPGKQPVRDSQAPSRPSYPQQSIDQLVSLGFNREQAIAALDACNGNVELAAGLLFN